MRPAALLLLTITVVPCLPAPPVPENHREVYITNGRRASNMVALTYDDGPDAQWTPQIMELLNELDCPATFYLLGESCRANPRTLSALASSDFEIGNHTMNHRNLREQSEERIRTEAGDMQELLIEAGMRPPTFRPPYGNAGRRVVNYVYGELGLEIVLWSIDTEDWKTGTTQQEMIDGILENAQGGDIILMHDRYRKSLETTRAIIPALRDRGLQFVTVSELIQDMRTHPDDASGEATASQ